MKRNNYTDSERIMRRIPGVYSQTEDGYGLRTNLGMRGTTALRTTKINILEDGVPRVLPFTQMVVCIFTLMQVVCIA